MAGSRYLLSWLGKHVPSLMDKRMKQTMITMNDRVKIQTNKREVNLILFKVI